MAKRGETLPFQVRLYAHGATSPGYRSAHSTSDKAVIVLEECYIASPVDEGDGRTPWARGEVVDTRNGEVVMARQ